uniref:Uncharacterized protein n=1 Tax=Vibrio cyclitrophicus TaxID=47951 RepID=A0A7Z1MLC1_9VIBR|nr:hypothetical protein BCS91_19215 [Vibrio cyclitrophicus]PMP31540.1 hypothetical protein BCS90_11135 [Vibrio cyclitrophicus]
MFNKVIDAEWVMIITLLPHVSLVLPFMSTCAYDVTIIILITIRANTGYLHRPETTQLSS